MAATGFPPWSRATGPGFYGASETLSDYLGLTSPNVLDSVTAGQYAALSQASAWMAAVAPMWVLKFDGNEPSDPTVTALSMVSGSATYAGASEPTGFPDVAYDSTGTHLFTASSPYTDEGSVSGAFAIRSVEGFAETISDRYASAFWTSSVVTAFHRDWSGNGAATDGVTGVWVVW